MRHGRYVHRLRHSGRSWRPGARIQGRRGHFKQGDAASEFYVIQSGKVDIRLGNRLLGTLTDYDVFGEMALIDAAPRSATAIAATDVKIVPVGEKQFLFLVSRTPHFALNIMRVLARRLRAQNSVV